MKYKYKGFKARIYTDWIYPLPAIEIKFEDMRYYPNNIINISIHWIIFHCRWLWMMGGDQK